MIYAVGIFAICFVVAFCSNPSHRIQATLLYPWYRVLGLARDRERFFRFHRLFLRSLGAVMIVGIVVGVALHAFG